MLVSASAQQCNVDGKFSESANASEYWQHYGLEQAPFSQTNLSQSYFPVAAWNNALRALQNPHPASAPLTTVTGVLGNGKSIFLAQLASPTNEQIHIYLLKANSRILPNYLPAALASAFDLPTPDTDIPLEQQLQQQLNILEQYQNTYVLLVDDADRLPLKTLGILLKLAAKQEQDSAYLHIILSGELQLQERIDSIVKDQKLTLRPQHLVLEPLNLEETKNYLAHKLHEAGFSGTMPLSSLMIKQIYESSGGVPARINRLAEKKLNEISQTLKKLDATAAAKKINITHTPNASDSRISLTTIPTTQTSTSSQIFKAHQVKLISLLILGILLLWLWKFNPLDTANQTDTATIPNPIPPRLVAANAPIESAPNAYEANKAAKTTAPTSVPAVPQTPQAPAITKTAAPTTQISAVKTSPLPVLDEIKPIRPKQTFLAASSLADFNKLTTPATPVRLSFNKQAEIPNFQYKIPTASTNTNTPAKVKVKQQVLPNKPATLFEAEKSLLTLKNGYTVQLLATRNFSNLKSYQKNPSFSKKLHFFRTQNAKQNWYVMTYGHYPTATQAQVAIKALPPELLQQAKPWIRSINSIQRAIK